MTWDIAEILKIISGPAVGFLFGSLLTGYVQWGIEKRKQILLRRRELVTGWRMELIPLLSHDDGSWDDLRAKLMSSPYYASLRPHLKPDLIRQLEQRRRRIVGDDFPIPHLSTEIARTEREWKLV